MCLAMGDEAKPAGNFRPAGVLASDLDLSSAGEGRENGDVGDGV